MQADGNTMQECDSDFRPVGALSAAPDAINNTLSTPGGGHVVGLVVGGAAEALMSRRNMYRILIKKRKGFCRLALKHG